MAIVSDGVGCSDSGSEKEDSNDSAGALSA